MHSLTHKLVARTAMTGLLLAAAPAFADPAPTIIVHNGRLLDGTDRPVEGMQILTFAIYPTLERPSSSEVPLWNESYAVRCSKEGVYAVELGGPTDDAKVTGKKPFGADVFVPGQERYLEIAIGAAQLSPRLHMGSMPFAITSRDTALLGGHPPEYFATAAALAAKSVEITATAPLAITGPATAPVVGLAAASATQDGYLSKADFAGFASARTAVSTAALPLKVAGGALTLPAASESSDGYLAMADFAAFKAASTAAGAPLAPLAINGSGALTIPVAGATTDGYLSQSDWATFSGKANKTGEGSYIQNRATGTAQEASLKITGTATVGALDVVGGIKSTQQIRAVPVDGKVVANTGLAIDWNQGNVQSTSASCGAATFSNMLEGGAYTLVVTGTTAGTCTFTQTNAPDTVTAFKFQPSNGPTTASSTSVFTFLRAGGVVYVSWVSGF